MADIKFTNFAQSTLAAGVDDEAVTIAVEPGQGARFPALTVVGDFFYLTLENASLDREIVKVTARLNDAMTVVRGQDGTYARMWNAGDPIALRMNAAAIEQMFNQVVRRADVDGSALIPQGTTAERGLTPAAGYLRYNTDLEQFEGYSNLTGWGRIGGDATNAELEARAARDEAEAAQTAAEAAEGAASAAQTAAEIAAASINIPNSLAGESANFLRVKVDETGYELVSSVARPTFYGFKLSADRASLVHTVGTDDYDVAEYTTWAIGDGVSYSIVNNNLVINL